ncbi:MAG TPA: hypothetical protein PKJ63_14335, partial [Cyclobacteriaceae bacterium]|nr:hypothetical protein [Cyclobacteriaceae bacterium]
KNGQDVINWPSKLNTEFFQLLGVADVHEPALTKGVMERRSDVDKQWATYKSDLQTIMNTDVAAYNQMFREKNIPAIVLDKN